MIKMDEQVYRAFTIGYAKYKQKDTMLDITGRPLEEVNDLLHRLGSDEVYRGERFKHFTFKNFTFLGTRFDERGLSLYNDRGTGTVSVESPWGNFLVGQQK
jgi:hypothetical protein